MRTFRGGGTGPVSRRRDACPGQLAFGCGLGLGLNPVILDWDSFTTQLRVYQEAAGATPGPVVVRVNGRVTAEPLGDRRTPLTGSVEEVRADVARAAELGVDEVFWDHIAANVPHPGLLDALNSIAGLRD